MTLLGDPANNIVMVAGNKGMDLIHGMRGVLASGTGVRRASRLLVSWGVTGDGHP